MAAYTSQTRLRAILGTALLTEIEATTGVSLSSTIAAMSDVVAGYLRNSGYTPPTTTDADSDPPDDLTVCLATEALVVRQLLQTPDVNLPLPEDWANSAQVIALQGILSGSVQLNLALNEAAAVGGNEFTSSVLTVAEGGSPPIATRLNLSGF